MSSSEAFLEPAEFVSQQAFLKRLARGILGDDALAEDVVQDAWLAWIKNKDRVQSSHSWLAQTVRNLSSNARREQARRDARERHAARAERIEPTEDDLELAQFVLAAVRALDEPLRTTIVLRYLHELTPKEIAQRQQLPIDTVKARLKRGLVALRAALDRRHGRDARVWAPLLSRIVGSRENEGGGANSLAGTSTPHVVPIALACTVLAGLLLLFLALRRSSSEAPVGARPLAAAVVPEPELDTTPLQAQRAPIESKPVPFKPPVRVPRAVASGPEPFEWPQFAGGPTRNNLRPRASSISVPRIAWHVDAVIGQATMRGTTLYAGGYGLLRIRARDGKIEALVESPVDAESTSKFVSVGEAPLVTDDSVIAHELYTRAIVAYDSELAVERWRFDTRAGRRVTSERPPSMPGLLAGPCALYALGSEIVALQLSTGALLWRFEVPGDSINLAPASDGARVFFATERGHVYALDLTSGTQVWHAQQQAQFGWTHPVVVGERLVIADRGSRDDDRKRESKGGSVHAFATTTGDELWSQSFGATGCSTPGIGERFFVAGFGRSVARFWLENGKRFEPTVKTGSNAFGSPTIVGDELVFGNLDGHLYVHELGSGELRWSFFVPGTQVQNFVHTGDRIYVATTRGLYALEDDPKAKFTPGFVLEAPNDSSGLSDESEGFEDQR